MVPLASGVAVVIIKVSAPNSRRRQIARAHTTVGRPFAVVEQMPPHVEEGDPSLTPNFPRRKKTFEGRVALIVTDAVCLDMARGQTDRMWAHPAASVGRIPSIRALANRLPDKIVLKTKEHRSVCWRIGTLLFQAHHNE